MEKSRVAGALLILLAFLIPTMTAVFKTGELGAMCGLFSMLAVLVWFVIEKGAFGVVIVDSFEKASLLTLFFGIVLAIVIVVTGSSLVLWWTVAMAICMITTYHII